MLGAALGLAARLAAARRRGARDPPRGRAGTPIYRQRRVGRDGVPFDLYKLRTMVTRRRDDGLGPDRRRRRRPHHAASARCCGGPRSTSCRTCQRPARRDVAGRPAPDRAGPGRPLHRAPAPPARRAPGHHGLGPGQRPRLAALARADRARPLRTSTAPRCATTCSSSPPASAWCSRATGSTAARPAAGGSRPPSRVVAPAGGAVRGVTSTALGGEGGERPRLASSGRITRPEAELIRPSLAEWPPRASAACGRRCARGRPRVSLIAPRPDHGRCGSRRRDRTGRRSSCAGLGEADSGPLSM